MHLLKNDLWKIDQEREKLKLFVDRIPVRVMAPLPGSSLSLVSRDSSEEGRVPESRSPFTTALSKKYKQSLLFL